jgi:uncharacterized protein DUF6893
MIRRFVLSVLFTALAALAIQSLPDVARYLKLREM